MNFPSCVVVVIASCVDSPLGQFGLQKLHILDIYAHVPLVCTHEMLGQFGLNFLNGSHIFFPIMVSPAFKVNHVALIFHINVY